MGPISTLGTEIEGLRVPFLSFLPAPLDLRLLTFETYI